MTSPSSFVRPLSLSVAAAGVVLCAGLALGQAPAPAKQAETKPAEAKPAETKPAEPISKATVLAVEYSALQSWFSDPKDRAMGEALALVPARVAEILKEPTVRTPAHVSAMINSIVPMLGKPGRVVAKYNETPTGGLYGYGISAGLATGDEAKTKELHQSVMQTLERETRGARGGPQFRPSKRFPGMTDLQTPVAVLSFGPRQSATGWRYEFTFGTFDEPDAGLDALPAAPEGTTPMMRAAIDFRGLTPARDWLLDIAGANRPQVEDALKRAEQAGMLGSNALKYEYSTGRLADRTVTVSRHRGMRAHVDQWGFSTVPLTPEIVRAVPADASAAYVMRVREDRWTWVHDELAKEFDPSVNPEMPAWDDVTAWIRDNVGVELRDELVASLGGSMAIYTSTATGGGGLGSGVVLLSVRDRAKLEKALATTFASANETLSGASVPAGKIRAVQWKDGSTQLWSARIDGWPVPLELTIGIADMPKGTPAAIGQGWLVFGLTPQAVVAAGRQARGDGDAGLLSIAAVREAVTSETLAKKGITSLAFTDGPRAIAGGYTAMTMLGSAVSGFVRSPAGDREVPMLVPLYNDLTKGVRPTISWTWWEGDDIVTQSWGDPSVLVHATATVGAIGSVAPLLIIPSAAIGAGQSGSLPRGLRAHADALRSEPWRLVAPWSVPGTIALRSSEVQRVMAFDQGWDALVQRRGGE